MGATRRHRLWPGAGPVLAAFTGRRRALAADAPAILRRLDPPPRVEGAEHIPPDQPCLIVVNHYERPGLWVAWFVVLISDAVARHSTSGARPVRWLWQGELTEHRVLGLPLPRWLSRMAIRRAATVYGQIILPWGATHTAGRSAAIRAAAAALARGESVGLFPEGYTSHQLIEARPGSGALLALLGRGRVPILPVGAFEEDGRLVARFGQPFHLARRDRADREAVDRAIRTEVMRAIARLLPEELRGFYRQAAAVE